MQKKSFRLFLFISHIFKGNWIFGFVEFSDWDGLELKEVLFAICAIVSTHINNNNI